MLGAIDITGFVNNTVAVQSAGPMTRLCAAHRVLTDTDSVQYIDTGWIQQCTVHSLLYIMRYITVYNNTVSKM